jgi:hypothetical protein
MSTKPTPSTNFAELNAYQAGYRAAQKDAELVRKTEYELNSAPGCVGDLLICPCCDNSEYLHHDVVEVFERSEDAEICRQTTVTSGETLIQKTNGRGNPSFRRHGLSIRFWCEECEAKSVVAVAQHKGNTFLTHRCIEPNNGDVAL